MATAIAAIFMVIWWFGVGPFLLVFNGIAHSETNCLIGWAKHENKSTVKLRFYQVLHCLGYLVWGIGLVAIPLVIKHYMN